MTYPCENPVTDVPPLSDVDEEIWSRIRDYVRGHARCMTPVNLALEMDCAPDLLERFLGTYEPLLRAQGIFTVKRNGFWSLVDVTRRVGPPLWGDAWCRQCGLPGTEGVDMQNKLHHACAQSLQRERGINSCGAISDYLRRRIK